MSKLFMNLLISANLLFGAAMVSSVTARADEHHRYYDRDHKDWHEWNEVEDRAYRHYLEERHEHYRAWVKANQADQRAYWRWRHEHLDWR